MNKLRKKKKNLFLLPIITIVVVVITILLLYPSYIYNKEKELLAEEINSLITYLEPNHLNIEAINDITKSDITTGSRRQVESALEEYLLAFANTINSTNTIIDDDYLVNLLTVTNYQNDGPTFVKSKAYIKTTKDTLNSNKENFLNYTNKDKVMNFLSSTSKKNQVMFSELINEFISNANSTKELITAIDKLINILTTSDEILTFLSENPNGWYIENNQIMFITTDLLNTYNSLVAKVN